MMVVFGLFQINQKELFSPIFMFDFPTAQARFLEQILIFP